MQSKYEASSILGMYQGAGGQKSSEPKTFEVSQGLVCGGGGTPDKTRFKGYFVAPILGYRQTSEWTMAPARQFPCSGTWARLPPPLGTSSWKRKMFNKQNLNGFALNCAIGTID